MIISSVEWFLLTKAPLISFLWVTVHGEGDTVSFEEVQSLKKNSTVFFVDVRNHSQVYATGSIPGSVNIPLYDLPKVLVDTSAEDFIAKYNKRKPTVHTPMVLYCQTGKRSRKAQKLAWKLGFKDVRVYPGSWDEWSHRKSCENHSA